jgi:PEP-CTERM motif
MNQVSSGNSRFCAAVATAAGFMTHRVQTSSSAFFAAALFAVTPFHAHGAVLFAASGNDLRVTLDSPLSFTVTSEMTDSFFGVVFPNVYTAVQAFNNTFSTTSMTVTLPGGFTSTVGALAGVDNPVFGIAGPNDLWLTWNFGAGRTVAIGDIVTVGVGTTTLTNFISLGGSVPDLAASSAVFVDNSLLARSGVTPIPEPSTFLMISAGLLCVALRRGRGGMS